MNEDTKIACPGCGDEMNMLSIIMNDGVCFAQYRCTCGWHAPGHCDKSMKKAAKRARDSAIKRALKTPLTIGEVKALELPAAAWIERRENGVNVCIYPCVISRMSEDALTLHAKPDCSLIEYGRKFRVWLNKPTDEEREAAEWGTLDV